MSAFLVLLLSTNPFTYVAQSNDLAHEIGSPQNKSPKLIAFCF